MTFGELIRKKRLEKNETVKSLAKKLKISEAFVRHIEYSKVVPVSPRLVGELTKHYKLSSKKIAPLVAKRNRDGKRYYREYRKKAAA